MSPAVTDAQAKVATVTIGTTAAQGELIWWNPRTRRGAVRIGPGPHDLREGTLVMPQRQSAQEAAE